MERFGSSVWMMIPPTHGLAVTKASRHYGEKFYAGLGMGHGDVTDYRSGQNPNGWASRGGPKILNIPKILGGVVEATTNSEPLVESNIFIKVPKIIWVWIVMQGNIEQVLWVPFVLLWPLQICPILVPQLGLVNHKTSKRVFTDASSLMMM